VVSLGNALKKHPKLNRTKDAANMVTFALLGAQFTKSHTSINKKLLTYKARIAMVQQKQMKLGKEVKKLLDKVKKEKSKADAKSQEKMKTLEDALDKLLTKTSALGERFLKNDGQAQQLDVNLKKLSGANERAILNLSTTLVAIAANITKMVISAAVLDAASASDAVASIAESLSKS
jgi:Holliday junction resolvase RusA-like endonuclease